MTRARKNYVFGDEVATCRMCGQSFNLPIDGWEGRGQICIPCSRDARRLARRRDRVKNACKRYGVTVEEYDRLLAQQNGRCAICGESPASPSVDSDTAHRPSDFLHIDHDHKTGVVRGLLCYRCNVGIGCFRDDPALLGGAIGYLAEARGPVGALDALNQCNLPDGTRVMLDGLQTVDFGDDEDSR